MLIAELTKIIDEMPDDTTKRAMKELLLSVVVEKINRDLLWERLRGVSVVTNVTS